MPARGDERFVNLATHIPKELQRRLKLHCLEAGTQIQDFAAAAIRQQLERKDARQRGGSSA